MEMKCTRHQWSLPTQRGCLSCYWDGVVAEIQAAEGEQNAAQASARVQTRRRKATGAMLAHGTWREGRSRGNIARRERARESRERAKALLREGLNLTEVDIELGKALGWCSQQSLLHADLMEARREGEAAE